MSLHIHKFVSVNHTLGLIPVFFDQPQGGVCDAVGSASARKEVTGLRCRKTIVLYW